MEHDAPIYGSDTAINGDPIVDSSTPVGDGWSVSRRSRVTRGGLHTDCHLLRGHTSVEDDRAIRHCAHNLGTHRGCCRTLADATNSGFEIHRYLAHRYAVFSALSVIANRGQAATNSELEISQASTHKKTQWVWSLPGNSRRRIAWHSQNYKSRRFGANAFCAAIDCTRLGRLSQAQISEPRRPGGAQMLRSQNVTFPTFTAGQVNESADSGQLSGHKAPSSVR